MLSTSACARAGITLIHYNIRELETGKLVHSNPQTNMVRAVFDRIHENLEADLISINEIQYDLPGVPSNVNQSEGENLSRLSHLLARADHELVFARANTGKNAAKKPNGQYATFADHDHLQFADQVNFGLFPGQYSTGLLSQFKIKTSKIIHDVVWKKFNRDIDLSSFQDGAGNRLPDDMELFDKSFSDVTLQDRQGREFHVVIFHPVPAYHFGNKKTPNYARNLDQLRFLEWYTTGNTDMTVDLGNSLRPLPPGTPVIIVGDLNVDIKSSNPGAVVLQRMLQNGLSSSLPDFPGTYLGDGLASSTQNKALIHLDYIMYTSHFRMISGGVWRPEEDRRELGCGEEIETQSQSGRVSFDYVQNGKLCRASVTAAYFEVAKASDHLPIWASFEWKQ